MLSMAIDRPSIGTILDRAGHTRTVYGVPGSFVLGEPVDEGATVDLPPGVALDNGVVLIGDVRISLPGITEIFPISPEFVGARSETDTYAIRTVPGREAAFYLPED